MGPADLDVGIVPAQRSAEIDDPACRQQGAQRPLGFLFDFRPAGIGDRRAIAEEMVLHHLATCPGAGRRLPMPRLPSELTLSSPSAAPPPCTISASISVIGPSMNRKALR